MIHSVIIGVVTGVLSGLCASLLFHLLLKHTTPKLEIAREIERRFIEGSAKPEFRIKIVNKRKRYATDFSLFLSLVHEENGPDGIIVRMRQLDICEDQIPYIEPYERKDKNGKYAVRVQIPINLDEEWLDDRIERRELTMFCRDAFSGSGKFFTRNYYSKADIITGRYNTGKRIDVKPLPIEAGQVGSN